MVLMTTLFALLGIAVFIMMILFFGRFFPRIPFLNEWKVRATVHEIRGNGLFPRWERARNSKDAKGHLQFELKKSGIRTPPKKLVEAVKGSDGKDYIELIQISKDVVIPVSPKFVKKDITGTKVMDEMDVEKIVKDENIFRWKEEMMREHAKKIAKKPDSILQKLEFMSPFILLIGVAIFAILMIEPINNYFSVANSYTQRFSELLIIGQEVQKTNLEVLEALKPFAAAFAGG